MDTISALVTFALWDFGRFPDFRKRAAEEVAKFFPSRDDMTALALEELPFLNAFLNESMRIHDLTVALIERTPPAKGAELLGHYIPPDVVSQKVILIIGDGHLQPLEHFDGSPLIFTT